MSSRNRRCPTLVSCFRYLAAPAVLTGKQGLVTGVAEGIRGELVGDPDVSPHALMTSAAIDRAATKGLVIGRAPAHWHLRYVQCRPYLPCCCCCTQSVSDCARPSR